MAILLNHTTNRLHAEPLRQANGVEEMQLPQPIPSFAEQPVAHAHRERNRPRQAVEKQLNKIENSNKFSRAIAFGNNQVFLYGDKVEQEMAEGCRRLIKNAIVCWNYLYLTQQIVEADSVERRQELLTAVQQGSVVSWRHVNVHGEYDFSDEKLQDAVGLCLPVSLGLLLPHSEDGAELPASGC